MRNFVYFNPVRIVFGANRIEKTGDFIPEQARVLVLIGGGSVRKNGVLVRVEQALGKRRFHVFSGIEANPDHDTCMQAVAEIRKRDLDFILAVGGGSVIDAAKYIAAAAVDEGDSWELVTGKRPVEAALPIGCVLTLAATGSEMNGGSVISRRSMNEKLPFGSERLLPKFSILDPTATVSVSPRMSACGVVDAFVHVMEQYLTHSNTAPLQDRQAEAILSTLMEEGPKVLENPEDLDVRANLMWCATQALNGLIGCGVPQDWATHMIGHELTAAFGLAHAESLAIVLPALWKTCRETKKEKLAQLGRRVFGIPHEDTDALVDATILATEAFFRKMGLPTSLKEQDLSVEETLFIGEKIETRGLRLGETRAIDAKGIRAILARAE